MHPSLCSSVNMGEALYLVIGGLKHEHALIFASSSVLLQVFVPYRSYAPILKFLTLVLFLYVAVVFTMADRACRNIRTEDLAEPRLPPIDRRRLWHNDQPLSLFLAGLPGGRGNAQGAVSSAAPNDESPVALKCEHTQSRHRCLLTANLQT
jgi:hypothetical protein